LAKNTVKLKCLDTWSRFNRWSRSQK